MIETLDIIEYIDFGTKSN